ncbi:hypothetical protein [Coraliomargarita parva]|nr:hypothetical protein [Coraliomargarita parva]
MDSTHSQAENQQKADRARRIIYLAMAVGMLLPLLLAWIFGAFSF